MSTGYKIKDQEGLYFLTFQIVGWVDIFTRSLHADLSGFIRDFKNHTSKAFLECLENKDESRKDWLKLVFEYHGKFKNKQTFQVWTHENHAEHIFSQKFIEQKLEYLHVRQAGIHNNSVKAGIVEKPEDYLYSSARNYADMDSIMNISQVDIKWITIY